MNDIRRQQSQKPRLPRKIQHESQRKFNRHIKLFYSITHQEPVSVLPQSCLILTCQSNLQNTCLLILFFFSIYIYIYLAAPGLRFSKRDLQLQGVGSGSLTRDLTWAPCFGTMESQPLDHQGSPCLLLLSLIILLPLQAAKSSEKSSGGGGARCSVRRLNISVASSLHFTLTQAGSWPARQNSGEEHSFWGLVELGLNPSPANY